MKPATLSIIPLLGFGLLSIAAAYPGMPLAAGNLPDTAVLILVGAIVFLIAGFLSGMVNFLKVLEYFKSRRAGELAGNGVVTRETLDEKLDDIIERMDKQDKEGDDKLSVLTKTVNHMAQDMAAVKTSITFLTPAKRGGPAHG